MTDRVRAACKALDAKGTFSCKDVVYHIDPADSRGELNVRRAFQDICDRGELVRIGRAKYRHIEGRAPTADVRQRIYRAMHVKGVFCAADIVKLTEADQSYVSAVIRRLARTGDLELTGRTGKTNRFRVRHADKFYLEHVK